MLIAQITDLHLVEKNQHWLSEPATEVKERLLRTIFYMNGLNPKPDVVLVTGDLTENGDFASYCHLNELLSLLKVPFYVIPGNHDRRENLKKTFSHHSYMPSEGFVQYVVEDYPVRLIGLDTLVEGEDYGHLCNERVSWLQDTLKAEPQKPTLVFMHHPPIKIGMRLFDQIRCRVPASFECLVSETDHLIGIITGHYHHLCISSFGKKLCFLAPSVAPAHYFAHPEDTHVTALELNDPALTLHKWQGGTLLTSHVVPIQEPPKRIDWGRIIKNHR